MTGQILFAQLVGLVLALWAIRLAEAGVKPSATERDKARRRQFTPILIGCAIGLQWAVMA